MSRCSRWAIWFRCRSTSHAVGAGIAAKGFKEVRYHVRHSTEWMLRLGDGTEESHTRVQSALDELWRFTGELFESDDIEHALVAEGLAADSSRLMAPWRSVVDGVVRRATLTIPAVMLLEAFLSFLGLGVQPPMSSWGVLIKDGAEKMEEFPWLLEFPAAIFSLTLFSLNFLGDGLRDALDVRSSKD